jgi:hypothetical protein
MNARDRQNDGAPNEFIRGVRVMNSKHSIFKNALGAIGFLVAIGILVAVGTVIASFVSLY